MKNILGSVVAVCIAAACAPFADAQILWNNGPVVTHPGAGPGGVDVSMASVVPNAGGSNTTATLWRADDFTVGGPGWSISSIGMLAYDTGFGTPRWTSARIEIREAGASGPGALVASVAATWDLAGINRTFNGVTANTDRQLNALTGNFAGLLLGPGNYWVVLSITHAVGTTTSWVPYVMDPNPGQPNNPTTRVGNSMVTTDSGATWQAGIVTTGNWNQSPELPFTIQGTVIPEPTTYALLACGALAIAAAARRRRRCQH
jgi:hypothetical protein